MRGVCVWGGARVCERQSSIVWSEGPDQTQCEPLGFSCPASSENRQLRSCWESSSVNMHNSPCGTGPEWCLWESCTEAFALMPSTECCSHSVTPFSPSFFLTVLSAALTSAWAQQRVGGGGRKAAGWSQSWGTLHLPAYLLWEKANDKTMHTGTPGYCS